MKKSLSQRVKDLLVSIPQDKRLHNTLICNASCAPKPEHRGVVWKRERERNRVGEQEPKKKEQQIKS